MTHQQAGHDRALVVRELRLMLGRTAWLGEGEMALSSILLARPSTQPGGETGRARYVYCVINSEHPLRISQLGIGPDPSDVQTIHHRNIAAVVSDTAAVVHAPTKDHVLAHHHVNEAVMQQHTVVPMPFGTMFRTDDDIIELLRSGYDAFTDVLHKMRDKVEYGLRVLWNQNRIAQEIEAQDEGIRRLRDEICSSDRLAYEGRQPYGRLIHEALRGLSEKYVGDMTDRLRDVVIATRCNEPTADRMIMNAAFLVARHMAQSFESRVEDIASRYEKLTFQSRGPWPPYNFVNLRLKFDGGAMPAPSNPDDDVAYALSVEYQNNEELEGQQVSSQVAESGSKWRRSYRFSQGLGESCGIPFRLTWSPEGAEADEGAK